MKRKPNRNKNSNTFKLEFGKQPRSYRISNSLLTSAEAVVGGSARKMCSGKSHVLPWVPNSETLRCEDEIQEKELCKLQSIFTLPQPSWRMIPESQLYPGMMAVACIPPATGPWCWDTQGWWLRCASPQATGPWCWGKGTTTACCEEKEGARWLNLLPRELEAERGWQLFQHLLVICRIVQDPCWSHHLKGRKSLPFTLSQGGNKDSQEAMLWYWPRSREGKIQFCFHSRVALSPHSLL